MANPPPKIKIVEIAETTNVQENANQGNTPKQARIRPVLSQKQSR